MELSNFITRIRGKINRELANRFCRRLITINSSVPLISFTFDDAPKSAFDTGGAILKSYNAKATYYVSLSLIGNTTEVGEIASTDDLVKAVDQGNELGCHTFDHVDAWETTRDVYIKSVTNNSQALENIVPGLKFKTFAYPKNGALMPVKASLQSRFICCRGGGQESNIGSLDLNLVKSCFLDRRTKIDIESVQKLIDKNTKNRGWLIFSTHDVTDNPSIYGCTPDFFREVVEYSVRSGAELLPVIKACERLLESSS